MICSVEQIVRDVTRMQTLGLSAAADRAPGTPLGPGRLILVVGPSGSGKDTLIAMAREQLADAGGILFPTRLVTRSAPVGENEALLSEADLARDAEAGRCALEWHAHGLHYAVPATIDADIAAGRTVVVNVSRSAVPAARRRYAHVIVVYVDAAQEIRAERLFRRGRESRPQIDERLATARSDFGPDDADVLIVNEGPPEEGARALARLVTGVAAPCAAPFRRS